MNPVLEQLQAQAELSTARLAAIAILQLDPHAREDLATYHRELTEAERVGDAEAIRFISESIVELLQPSVGGKGVEAWGEDASDPRAAESAARVDADAARFFRTYQRLKHERGLLTIQALADAAGLSPTTVQAIEKQRVKPQAKTLNRLAKAFGVEPRVLYDGE